MNILLLLYLISQSVSVFQSWWISRLCLVRGLHSIYPTYFQNWSQFMNSPKRDWIASCQIYMSKLTQIIISLSLCLGKNNKKIVLIIIIIKHNKYIFKKKLVFIKSIKIISCNLSFIKAITMSHDQAPLYGRTSILCHQELSTVLNKPFITVIWAFITLDGAFVCHYTSRRENKNSWSLWKTHKSGRNESFFSRECPHNSNN